MAYTTEVARRFITVAEMPLFIRQASDVWDDAKREAFIEFIARNPNKGTSSPKPAVCGRSDGRGLEAANAAARG
jgi:hypothetical protein